jgi:Tfp pilus assembly protein PilF
MRLISSLLLCAAAAALQAAPRLPGDDGEVLERLPLQRSDPIVAELRSLSGVPLARRYFELAMAEGDARYVGYAEAALRPVKVEESAEALLVRGLLRQFRHDFDGALGDFASALQMDPAHVGARAWRAAVFMVKADYPAAARECERLAEHASELLATGCQAYVDATTGKTRAAYDRLRSALAERPDAGREARVWTLTRLAEMAWRLEDTAAAERHFRAALALGVKDNFLLAAYADFLLEQKRPRDVVALLKGMHSDTLLLRLALAEKQLGMKEAEAHIRTLGERFAAAALRKERLHLAEEARYQLDLKGDARAALAAAAENWRLQQREPRDAAILLEAALAVRDPGPALPALRWLDESGFQSRKLRALAEKLK